MAPSTLSLIRNMFLDARQRTVAISVWITSFSIGGAIGPLIGGALLQSFWWGSVFLISVPVMVLVLIVGPRLLPEYRDPAPGRLDLTSAAMSLAAILSVIFGLKQIAQDGISLQPVATIVAGVALGLAFVRRQLHLEVPLVDLRLFREPGFSASLAAYGLSILVMFGGFLFLPQYLQLVLGLAPFAAGLWTLPWACAFIVGSSVTPPLVRRFHPAQVMTVGLLVSAAGIRDVHDGGARNRFPVVRGGIDALLAGHGAGVHADDGPHHRHGAARARGRGIGDLRDQRRTGWRAGHRAVRQHRRGDLPDGDGVADPGRRSRPARRRLRDRR